MSVVDMVSRMAEIQTSISQMMAPAAAAATAPAPAAATSAGSATNAASFAEALTAAAGASGATATTPTIPALPAIPGAAAAAPGATGVTGQAIVEDAKKYIGVPYVWGGTDPKTGLDCSGLVQRVYKDFGINLPRVAVDQGNAGTTVPNLAAAKPGDLLVMHNGGHIGIYMGNNQYIHAPVPGQNVQIATIPAGAVFDKITRILPDTATQAPAAAQPALADVLAAAQAALRKGAAA